MFFSWLVQACKVRACYLLMGDVRETRIRALQEPGVVLRQQLPRAISKASQLRRTVSLFVACGLLNLPGASDKKNCRFAQQRRTSGHEAAESLTQLTWRK